MKSKVVGRKFQILNHEGSGRKIPSSMDLALGSSDHRAI